MSNYKIFQPFVVVCQASIGGWEQGIRKGCPYIFRRRMKLDRVVGADLSRALPIDRPSLAFSITHLICSFLLYDLHLSNGVSLGSKLSAVCSQPIIPKG